LTRKEGLTYTYSCIREYARQIASRYPAADFYVFHPHVHALSRRFFATDPTLLNLKKWAHQHMDDDFGHGWRHAVKVSLDAGALIIIECQIGGRSQEDIQRQLRLVQSAGLLHDIKRKSADHAACGAEEARSLLMQYPFSPVERETICKAIGNHEAFKSANPIVDLDEQLVSSCLYDADKFRWGPDNFTDTVWAMVIHLQIPLDDFIGRYPKGMIKIAQIKDTFRSQTGQIYGPQFIDTGLEIGRHL